MLKALNHDIFKVVIDQKRKEYVDIMNSTHK